MALEIKEKKERKPIKRPSTILDYQEAINSCNAEITKQMDRIKKYEAKIEELKKQEILSAIINSGKSLEEILEIVKN